MLLLILDQAQVVSLQKCSYKQTNIVVGGSSRVWSQFVPNTKAVSLLMHIYKYKIELDKESVRLDYNLC